MVMLWCIMFHELKSMILFSLDFTLQPSKPGERWLGSRAEVILSRKPEPSPTLVRARTQPASQVVPGMTRGQDNHAFNHDTSGQGLRSGKNTPDHLRGKPPR